MSEESVRGGTTVRRRTVKGTNEPTNVCSGMAVWAAEDGGGRHGDETFVGL